MEVKLTVQDLLQAAVSEFCENYCRYPEECRAQVKDIKEAEDYLYEHHCTKCPMNVLI